MGPYFHLWVSGTLTTLVFTASVAFFLWPLLFWQSFAWFAYDRTRDHPYFGLFIQIPVAIVALIAGRISSSWLVRLPKVYRQVRHLLDETQPVAGWLTVSSFGRDPIYYAELETSDPATPFRFQLGGVLPPSWLSHARARTRVYVYGQRPGPYVVEFPDGRLALVQPDSV